MRSSSIASRHVTPVSLPSQEQPREARAQSGLVVAVFGARSNVGVTTVATSLAREFRALENADVALAELDARAVRARPPVDPAADRLTISGSDATLVRQPDGVWVFATTRPRTPATGDAKGVTVALEAIRSRFAVSVVDLEHQVNERTLAALDAADRILFVTEGSVPSLRGTQRVLRLCRRLNYADEKLCVVLNRYDAPGSLDTADVAAALKREVFWRISNDAGSTMAGLARKLLAD